MHVHFGTNPASVALLCRRLGGPQYSVTVHGPEEFDNPLILSLPEKIADAKFVVAISEHGRGQLKRWCPYERWPKVALVKCGLAEDFLGVEPTPVPDVDRIVCIARLSAQKAIAVLIQALSLLQQEQTIVSVDIVGDGPDRASIEAMIDELSLRDRVNITGFVSSREIRQYIEGSRALVLPSLAEGLPVVVMEAFSLGRPVIASRVAGVPELVEDGVNGWLVPPGETTDLAVAIRRLLDTPVSVLSAMASRGREHVAREHDIRRQSLKLDELFQLSVNAPALE
jgi:glycosyltransferase involved in cell wall biosynthesis